MASVDNYPSTPSEKAAGDSKRVDDERHEIVIMQMREILRTLNILRDDIMLHETLPGHPMTMSGIDDLKRGQAEIATHTKEMREVLSPLLDNGTPKALAHMATNYKSQMGEHVARTTVKQQYLIIPKAYFAWLHAFRKPITWFIMTVGSAATWAVINGYLTFPVHPHS